MKRCTKPRPGPEVALPAGTGLRLRVLPRAQGLAATRPRRYAASAGRPSFLGSSMVEHPAVNRRVAGSNPARGANLHNGACFDHLALTHRRLCPNLCPPDSVGLRIPYRHRFHFRSDATSSMRGLAGLVGLADGGGDASGHACRDHVAALASNFGSRRRLKAALANTKSQSTFGRPRSFTLRIQAIVFSHPNAGSMRGRHA